MSRGRREFDFGNAGPRSRAPVARVLRQGADWCVSEYVCSAGPQDRAYEEHHQQVAIAAVVEGTFTYRADRGTALMHPGALLLGNPGTCYECGHDHSVGDRCIAFQFAPEYFAEVAASRAGSHRFTFPVAMLPANPETFPWFARLEARTAMMDRLELDEVIPAFVEAVIGMVSREAPSPVRISARDQRRISNAVHAIEQRSSEALDLDALASAAAMSKYHFLRTFRHSVGMTPYQYLLGIRMRRAAVRLMTSAEPISTIAFDTGFGDLSTFNGKFRSVFGVSPRLYRARERRQLAHTGSERRSRQENGEERELQSIVERMQGDRQP